MSLKKKSVAETLRAAFNRKQLAHPGYSLRALARDLALSPAFVSKVLSGKKLPPKERLQKFSYVLELDVLEKEYVVKTLLLNDFGKAVIATGARRTAAKARAAPRKTSESPSKQVLSSWLNLALLEGLTLAPPHNSIEALRERLGVTAVALKRALETLAEAGLIQKADEQWQKSEKHIYFAGGRSRSEVRAFHDMMIAKARHELTAKTSPEDYQRRLINGFTMAVNPAHLERVKAKIIRFMDELSHEASDGECEDVYQLNVQFFPLTKKY